MAGRAARMQVTNSGACCPLWSESGKILYFATGNKVRSVSMPTDGGTPGRSQAYATIPPGGRLTGPASKDGIGIVLESSPFSSYQATLLRGWQRPLQAPKSSAGVP